MAQPAQTAPLVAREQTLQELWLQVAASATQGMRAAIVRGPAGSGKTRVLGAFAERARATGATVIAGASPAVGGHPYAALADALAAYVRSSPPAGGQVRRAGDALASLVPALVVLDVDDSGVLPSSLAIVQSAYRLVRQITDRRPLVLILDDAHLADADTCQLLAALVRHAGELPWTLVLGWRDPTDQVRDSALRLADVLHRDRDTVEVTLEPLGPAPAGELIGALLGGGLPSPGLVETVHRRSGGNPYYIEEMVRWLRDTGRLRRAGMQWIAAPGTEDELPPSLDAALRQRARALPEEARTVLEWVAVAGGVAELSLLGAVTEMEPAAMALGLDVLLRGGLLAERGGRRPEYRVHHPLVAECVYRDMSMAHRRLAHRALAEALAARGEPPGVLASHLVRAADVGDAASIQAALLAGADAEARTNFLQAVTWYEEALGLAGSGDLSARLLALDRLSELAGHAGRTDLALAAVDELLHRTAEDDRVRRATLLRRLATLHVIQGETEQARAVIEQALALGATGGAEAARLLVELAMVAEMTMPVPTVLEVVARGRAAAAAADASATAVVLRAFEAMAVAHGGEASRAAELAIAAAHEAARLEDPVSFGYTAVASAIANMLLGRFEEAARTLQGFADLGEDAGFVWGTAWLRTLLAEVQFFLGQMDAASSNCLRAEELAQRHGAPNVMPMPTIIMANILAAQGNLETAEERLAEARRWLEDRPNVFLSGWYWLVAGELAMARADFDAAVDGLLRMRRVFEDLGHHSQIGLSAGLVHALIAAERVDEALSTAREVASRVADHDLPLGSAEASVALAAALCAVGDAEAGLVEARRAVVLSDALDGALLRARSRAVLGRALAVTGRSDEAVEVLREAHAQLSAIPYARHRDAVHEALVALGGATPLQIPVSRRGSEADGPLRGLSRREKEVAELASTGMSSRSIALRLSLSERTVENHLQRIYAKLDLHSRAELIATVAGTSSAVATA